eukprot:PhF_6_TR12563/c0_g1_i1/m.19688
MTVLSQLIIPLILITSRKSIVESSPQLLKNPAAMCKYKVISHRVLKTNQRTLVKKTYQPPILYKWLLALTSDEVVIHHDQQSFPLCNQCCGVTQTHEGYQTFHHLQHDGYQTFPHPQHGSFPHPQHVGYPHPQHGSFPHPQHVGYPHPQHGS